MVSAQALGETDRRTVAAWAADCAERVLPLFESEAPDDDRPRDAIARARAFSRGELQAADGHLVDGERRVVRDVDDAPTRGGARLEVTARIITRTPRIGPHRTLKGR